MAEILTPTKALTVNPLKASQPIGASLAFLGLADCMPLEHGARGCTSFNKLFFMRHFNEPIPLQTTAMDQTTTVLGADDDVVTALATICSKNAPACRKCRAPMSRAPCRNSARNIPNMPASPWCL
jgi:nitrogenase molybdenum-iron protein NifN